MSRFDGFTVSLVKSKLLTIKEHISELLIIVANNFIIIRLLYTTYK